MIGFEVRCLDFFHFWSFSIVFLLFSFLRLIEVVRNVSPTWTVKPVATEKDFEPAWTGGDVLARIVEAPAFHKAYSNAVCVDGTELNATNW
jgi:hypothetical protein